MCVIPSCSRRHGGEGFAAEGKNGVHQGVDVAGLRAVIDDRRPDGEPISDPQPRPSFGTYGHKSVRWPRPA